MRLSPARNRRGTSGESMAGISPSASMRSSFFPGAITSMRRSLGGVKATSSLRSTTQVTCRCGRPYSSCKMPRIQMLEAGWKFVPPTCLPIRSFGARMPAAAFTNKKPWRKRRCRNTGMAVSGARADEPGSGRVSGARTVELPRWPLASLASAAPTPHDERAKDRGPYMRTVRVALRYPGLTLAMAALLLVAVQVAYGKFGRGVEFFPKVEPDYGQVVVHA